MERGNQALFFIGIVFILFAALVGGYWFEHTEAPELPWSDGGVWMVGFSFFVFVTITGIALIAQSDPLYLEPSREVLPEEEAYQKGLNDGMKGLPCLNASEPYLDGFSDGRKRRGKER